MKQIHSLVVAFVACLYSDPGSAVAESCPKTIAHAPAPHELWPEASTWFGSRALAVILPHDGTWSTTREGHQIAVKVFWYVSELETGMEREFALSIERLDDGINDASAMGPPSNAGLENGVWTVLTGIDFPSEGCWKIRGELRDQSLEFVVETVAR